MRTLTTIVLLLATAHLSAQTFRLELKRDAKAHALTVRIDDRDVLTYQHGPEFALPHYWPLLSPSGKLLTVQHPDPFPHHRSLWIADRVQLEGGPDVDFYHCWKNLRKAKDPESGHKHFIRHEKFTVLDDKHDNHAIAQCTLRWIVNDDTPVLDEVRKLRVVALTDGEYFLDLSWTLTAAHGDVTFKSDWVHYAWPYIRMHPQFSGDKGGTLIDDQGRKGQKATNEKFAKWIDYSNTIDDACEGLAVFLPADGKKRKWLTREYGCFGPRRTDELSGTKFVLKKGESMDARVGLLIHRGNVEGGKVAERYRLYREGKL